MPYIPPPFNISAGTTSNYLSAVTFSNSNGVSFGLNGSILTASVSPSGGGSINVSAGTTSNNLTALTFANSNGVSFGLNASTITATVATNYAGTGFTSTTTAGTAIVGTNNTAGLSLGVPAYLTTADLSQNSSKYAGTGFTSAGNNIGLSGTLNTAGLSLSATVAAQSNQSAIKAFGVSNTGQTAGNTGVSTGIDWVMAGSNSITLSQSTAAGGPNTVWIQHPAWITTADLSQNSSKYAQAWDLTGNTAGTTSSLQGTAWHFSGGANMTISGSSNTLVFSAGSAAAAPVNFSAGTTSNNLGSVVFSDSNRVSFGLSGSTITAKHALNFSAGTTSNNVSDGVTFADSNGVSFGLNASTITATVATNYLSAGVSTGGNTAGSTGMVSNRLVFVGSNGITLSQSTGGASSGTITISGDGVTLSSWDAYPPGGTSPSGANRSTNNAVRLFRFNLPQYVSAGVIEMPMSFNFTTVGTSSGRESAGLQFALFTRNGSTLSSLVSTSLSWGVTGNNSTYSISQITKTNFTGYDTPAQTTSAGVNITSNYTGPKAIQIPINTLLTPGNYWFGMLYTASTSSVLVGMQISYLGAALNANAANMILGPFGSANTWSTGLNFSGYGPAFSMFGLSSNVVNIPASIGFSDLQSGVAAEPLTVVPYLRFFSS